MREPIAVRRAVADDLDSIRSIYNEGIEDRVATLDVDPKSALDMSEWWSQHDDRFVVLVALDASEVAGWASLNRFSHRCAHSAIADLSVYVRRAMRGKGIGSALLDSLTQEARQADLHKIVLYALASNQHGKRLYQKLGFEEVGVFREHGVLDEKFVDVLAMERLLR